MTQAFRIEDLCLHRKIAEIACHPAQASVACSVTSVDRDNDSYVSHIWRFDLNGRKGVQITQGPGSDSSPRWSPDGTQLAFIGNRGGSPQLHVLPATGGEARQLGRLPQSVSDLRWLPTGEALIVTAAVLDDPDSHSLSGPIDESRESDDGKTIAVARKKCEPEVAWRLPYKEDGIGYLLRRQFHLFCIDARSGKHCQLSRGAFDVLAFAVAADGRIAYTRTREGRFAHSNDLWVCQPDGTLAQRLTRDIAIVMQPVWSPDGRTIAFTGAREEGDAEPRLWLVDVESGVARILCEASLDVAHPDAVHWDDNGRLVLTRAFRGRHQIVAVDIATQSIEVLDEADRQFGAFACSGSHWVYTVDHPSLPCELWTSRRQDEGSERKLSDLNPWWAARRPIEVSALKFDVPDGEGGTETIEGWLLRERGRTDPAPVLVDAHGGPASYALLDYDSNIFWQVLCSRGWAVLALNAVGSASYGREFCRRLAGRWGQIDLPQYLTALDQLREQGIGDGRCAISGKSYGGYLSALATGQSDRFTAAVVMAPVGNIETHYGTSDGGYYADPFYVASKPQFDRVKARELSPLHYIERSRTPTLFMQGKDDERCPKCQSEELFVSLVRAGDTPAELVLYAGESHSFLGTGSPSCREDAAQRIVTWIVRFTAPENVPSEVAEGHASGP